MSVVLLPPALILVGVLVAVIPDLFARRSRRTFQTHADQAIAVTR